MEHHWKNLSGHVGTRTCVAGISQQTCYRLMVTAYFRLYLKKDEKKNSCNKGLTLSQQKYWSLFGTSTNIHESCNHCVHRRQFSAKITPWVKKVLAEFQGKQKKCILILLICCINPFVPGLFFSVKIWR